MLREKKFELIEAPEKEFNASSTLSINVLATAPGDCIMLSGLPETAEKLISSGISLKLLDGDALCIGCEGGPTCLTRPIYKGLKYSKPGLFNLLKMENGRTINHFL